MLSFMSGFIAEPSGKCNSPPYISYFYVLKTTKFTLVIMMISKYAICALCCLIMLLNSLQKCNMNVSPVIHSLINNISTKQ